MNRIQRKDFFREIRKNKGRFFSLLFIVALGCAFYSGIRSSEPDMTASADRYYDETNFCDIRLVSTLGLTEEDLEAVSKLEGIVDCEGAKSVELFADCADDQPVMSVVSLGERINQFTVKEGRLPEAENECFMDVRYMTGQGAKIGDQVTLLNTDKEVPEELSVQTFTIVGYGTWAWYLNLTRGSASIGDGSVDAFMVLQPEVFTQEYYTSIFATVEGAMDVNCYEDAYDDLVKAVTDRVEAIEDVQVAERRDAIVSEAQEAIDEAKDQVADAKKELSDAEKKLKDGEEEYADGVARLEDGRKQLQDGKKEYEDGLKALQKGKEQYQSGLKEYNSGKKQYEDNLAKWEKGSSELEAGRKTLKESRTKLDEGQTAYKAGLKEYNKNKKLLESKEKELKEGEEKLPEAEAELKAQKKELQKTKKELEAKKAPVVAKQKELQSTKSGLEKQKKELQSQKSTLKSQKDSLKSQKKSLQSQKKELQNQKAGLQASMPSNPQTEEELAQAQQITAAIAVIDSSITEINQGIAQIDAGLPELESGLTQVEAGLSEVKEGLTQVEAGLSEVNAGLSTLNTALGQVEDGLSQIEDGEKEIAANKKAIAAGKKELEAGKTALAEGKTTLGASKKELDEGEKAYEKGVAELTANEKTLKEGKKELDKGKKELDTAKAALDKASREISANEKKLQKAGATIREKEQELAEGEQELADARKELDDGWKEYKEGKEEADEKIADAERKIKEGEEDLADLEEGAWYVLTRNEIQTSVEYGMDAERIGKIATVFPVIFFLVAALVSLTTMTRMIEEERMLIGTMKALGYGKTAIISKYLFYACSATLAGGILGVLGGSKVLPFVIMKAYGMLYTNVPYLLMPYQPVYCLTAIGMALLCTVGAAWAACYKELLSTPAALMRPPAPKSGKKIFLERVPFIWSRLNFSLKSTIRNLFRYKKRFIMTVLGIGGCMAILLVSYGLHDSIAAIVDNQYKKVWTYSAYCNLEENLDEEEKVALSEQIAQLAQQAGDSATDGDGAQANGIGTVIDTVDGDGSANDGPKAETMLARNISLDVTANDVTKNTYLYVVESKSKMEHILNLHDRMTREEHELTDVGVIISEKLGRMLKVNPGEEIRLKISDSAYRTVTVTATAENYLHNYIYMTPALYKEVYREAVAFNECALRYKAPLSEEEEDQLAEQILALDGVTNVSLVRELQESVDNMMNALNLVVWVLVIAAGLLVFVVSFNLNNINISERRRELASLKVLGFYDLEVAMYVYRENIFLTLFGILAGLFMGTWLHRYVITTLEVEMIMFGRNIRPASYLYSSLLTIVFSIMVNVMMYYKLKQIDMVESLKSVE